MFVPGTAPGDVLQARIVKDQRTYAFGIVEQLSSPSSAHIQPDCPVYHPCGGCCFRHISYEAELDAKQGFVQDAFDRIGGIHIPIRPILPSPQRDRYRNKVQFPVQQLPDGRVQAGFYAGRTHRVVPCGDCKLQPEVLNQIAAFICRWMEQFHVPAYDETAHTGLVRHIFLRRGAHSGAIMVCLVVNGRTLPHSQILCEQVMRRFPAVATVILNVNQRRTNVILGSENIVLTGPGYIEDELCGVPVRLGPLSFYQVNSPAAAQLYESARGYAALGPNDTLLDLYCGMGTIGLSMASQCQALVGVEIVPEAVKSAHANAKRMGVDNARFICADAGQAARQLASEGLRPDVAILDPPRKGCDSATLHALLAMGPRRIVMVSCNPSTAARDTAFLAQNGYAPVEAQPADLFPRTRHVECVVLLEKRP